MTSDQQALYEALCEQYPDFQRLVPRELAKLPWLELFTYRALPAEAFHRIDETLISKGLIAEGPARTAAWRTLFIEEMEQHRARVVSSVAPDDVEAIVKWFIDQDAQYPDLARRQIDYWHRPETRQFHSNGAFTVDVRKIDFWDISDTFYMENEQLFLIELMPDFLRLTIEEAIARHYLERALKEKPEAPSSD